MKQETIDKGLAERSEEVQEIMGPMPHWMLRWGITVIGLVFVFLVAGSWFFRYPDELQTPCVLTPARSSHEITAHIASDIISIRVKDRAKVRLGDTLCVLKAADGDKHAILTPDDGIAEADIRLVEGGEAREGQRLFRIIPADSWQALLCFVEIPAEKAAAVCKGMEVQVSLHGFSEESFGAVTGRIARVSRIPETDGTFSARVDFPLPLRTSNGHVVSLTDTVKATAKIRINDRRLIEKIFPISLSPL